MPSERRAKQVRLTDEAHAGLDALSRRHRVTVTAMIEAIGRLGQSTDPEWVEVFALAQAIDWERRSRH